MKMLETFRRKGLSAAFALSFALMLSGGVFLARAGNVPLVTGPQEPSQLNATLNTLVQSMNNSFGSLVATGTAFATAAGTAEQTAALYTIPGNLLVAGSTVRQTCWGVAANNANVKTAKLYFGGQNSTLTVTASAATQWMLEATTIINSVGASPSNTTLFRSTNTAVAPALVSSAGTDAVAAGTVTTKCTLTDATSSAADLTMQGYLLEIIH